MDSSQIMKLKMDLSDLELKEKYLSQQYAATRRSKSIGVIMTIGGILIGLGVSSSNNDLAGMLLLMGIIGIIIWIVKGIAAGRLNSEVRDITARITRIRAEIIRAEHA